MALFMKRTAAVTALLTILFAWLHRLTEIGVFLSLAITAGTVCYHMGMRLWVGKTVHAVMKNRADYTKSWYQPRAFEEKLYKALHVHAWKDKMPTYQPELFQVQNRDFDRLCQVMCQAEVVHECIVPLSFLPLLAAIPFGSFPVFMITSVLSALFDMLFVILQRYNRPRLVMLAERQKQRSKA